MNFINNIMGYLNYLAEFVGTFLLLSAILTALTKDSCFNKMQPLSVLIVLAIMVVLSGVIYGLHFNPAVSMMMYLNKTLNLEDLLPYIIAQLLGGVAAWKFVDISKTLKLT